MQENRSYVGPRGWAMLTLVGGAALAAPFLRPPRVDGVDQISQSSLAWSGRSPSSATGFGSSAGVSRAEAAVQNETPFGASSSAAARRQVSLSSMASGPASDRALNQAVGPLPTTQGLPEPKLPAWAKPRSRLDEIIAQGAAPPWPEESTSQTNLMTPPTPWMDQPQAESSVAWPDRRAGSSGSAAATPSVATPAVDETTSPKSTLSSWPDRSSPWQAHPPGIAPSVTAAVDEQQLAWSEPSFATHDLPALQASAEAKRDSPADSRSFGGVGSLAGAAVQRAASTSSPPERPHKPQFVYQPGIRPATNPR